METQSMLDALTDHLAIYHRSSGIQPESSRARQAVVEWLVGLNYERRRAALTFVDTSWVAILFMMQKYLRTEGLCTFFLLPDVPVVGGSKTTSVVSTTKATSKSNGKGIPKGGRKGTENSPSRAAINKDFTSCALPLPGLCFRRARGLVRRSEANIQLNSGNLLVSSIRLFSSGDGENKATRLCNFDTSCCVNCVTVIEDFIADIGTFLKVMDALSHGEFLNTPFLSAASTWEETPWLKGMGYYSMAAFIANKIEFELWSAWNRAQGTKKPPRSLGLKSRDTHQNGNAAVAASVFGRKQGCMSWWRKLERKERADLANFALAKLAKSEVLTVVGKARAARGKGSDSKTGDRFKSSSKNPSSKKLNTVCRTSLSDSEVEQPVGLGPEEVQGAEVAPYFAGLRALKELSESGLLGERYQDADFVQDDATSWLFGSALDSVHTFSDYVKRKVRDALVKARNDHVELQLLGDGSSGKAGGGNRVESSEGKVSKAKKKKRKSTATSKPDVLKEEDKTCVSKPVLPQDGKQVGHLENGLGYVEVQAQSCEVDQLSREAKSIAGGKQHVSRKGKGGISKGRKDDRLRQPTPGLNKSVMNTEELPRPILDTRSYSDGSLEAGNGPCSDCEAPSTSGDSPADSSPSFKVQVECPARSIGHCSSERRSSSYPIINLDQKKTEKLQKTSIPLLHSTSDKAPKNNRENDEVVPEKLVSMMDSGSGPSASDSGICQTSSSPRTTSAFFPQPFMTSENFPVSVGGTSDSRHKAEDRISNQTLPDTSLPIVEIGSPSVEKQDTVTDTQRNTNSESSMIRFGTVDAVIPELSKTSSIPVQANSSVKAVAPLLCSNIEERSLETTTPSNGKPAPSLLNGRMRFPTTPRQLDYSNGRSHSNYQRSPSFRSSPHEWPGSPQFGYFGAYHQPKATDWLQLDVGRGQPTHRMEPSLLSYRNTPVLRQQSGLAAESLIPRAVATRNGNVGNIDRVPPLLQPSYNISSPVGYTIASKEEPRLNVRHFISPSPFTSGYSEIEGHGSQGRSIDDSEGEDRIAYDTDVDDYGTYKPGEFDDLDGYMISEEEGERYAEDAAADGSSNYHQIFGGGVMYWNASDYAGLGYSRPGSLSSEDSSWARHEAELSAVLDDIVNYQPLAGSNVPSCSPSPPSSSSVPISFERLSPVASSNPLHFLPRPTAKEFSEKFGQVSNLGLSLDDQFVGARVPITLEVIEQIRADSSAQPILRPIVVVRERQLSSGEARRSQEANSPHTVPRSRRDLPGHRKRPPSPVLRCVPPAPPPPPPSPVSGPRRRKGLMGARSGSSSPRHWGLVNWPYKYESEGSEGKLKGESPEGFPIWGHKRGSTTSTPLLHPLSGALLRERLVAIPPLSLEQEHPDVSIPMKTTLLHNSNPALHLPLTKLLSALHLEIEAFSLQVEAENKMRKPFINMAVKKVAHSLQVLWPRSRINIFGSIATGLALPTSDVDLVVCLPPVRNLEPIKEAGILEGRNGIKETSLQQAARYLADQDWVKNDTMKTIENTPVPIIMMVAEFLPHQCEVGDEDAIYSFYPNIHKEAFEEVAKAENGVAVPLSESVICMEDKNLVTEDKKGPWGGKASRQLVHLDISFETPSHTGLRTAELVRELVGQYPALSPLAVVLKQFLTDRSLDHPYTGGLSSYCLVLLITRFLQHQHHHGKPSSNQNLGKLFMDFLHFFGCHFDPLKIGIRIRGGGMYVSRDRDNEHIFQICFKVDALMNELIECRLGLNVPMAPTACPYIDPLYIEDPLHPDNNVGRNCFRILQCVKAFADGYAVLEKKLYDISTGSEDVEKGAECLQLLQMILPCIMTK